MAVNRDVVALAISALAATVAGACLLHTRADAGACERPEPLDASYDASATVSAGIELRAVREGHATEKATATV